MLVVVDPQALVPKALCYVLDQTCLTGRRWSLQENGVVPNHYIIQIENVTPQQKWSVFIVVIVIVVVVLLLYYCHCYTYI